MILKKRKLLLGKSLILNALWTFLASRIRMMIKDCHNYENPVKLAILFTIEACRDPITADKHKHSAKSLFEHFSASPLLKDTRFDINKKIFFYILKSSFLNQIIVLGYPDYI